MSTNISNCHKQALLVPVHTGSFTKNPFHIDLIRKYSMYMKTFENLVEIVTNTFPIRLKPVNRNLGFIQVWKKFWPEIPVCILRFCSKRYNHGFAFCGMRDVSKKILWGIKYFLVVGSSLLISCSIRKINSQKVNSP
jgi:hypothetical protein